MMRFPSLPCVDSVLIEVNGGVKREITDEDREIASNFNVKQAIEEARDKRNGKRIPRS